MNLELFFNLMNIIFAFGSNNWLSVAISIIIFCYNIYNQIRKQYLLSFVIKSQKENKSAGESVGMIFKIKFVVYTIVSIYALIFGVLHFFDEMEEIGETFKIFDINKDY